jgi:2-oxoglutarate ferredoxin oxidoreductase subunit gamma
MVVPVVEIARDLGTVKAANVVALAAFVAKSEMVQIASLKASVEEEFASRQKLIPLNIKAVDEGVKAAGGSE